jgi:hypothetical protein
MTDTTTVEQVESLGIIEHQVASLFRKSYSKRLKFRYDIRDKRAYWAVVLNNDDTNASIHDTLEEAITVYNEL